MIDGYHLYPHGEAGGQMNNRILAAVIVATMTLAACGGSGDDGTTQQAQINDQIVIDPDLVAEARESIDNADQVEQASTGDTDRAIDDEPASDEPTSTTEPEIEVAEAEEDELDGVLNSLTMFNNCLADDGYEFIGAPGIGDATADEFEEPYLASLGKCATSSDILNSFDAYSSAQENRTPEEVAQTNYGLPIFRDCMIALGWDVGELVPDEKGALGFGGVLNPPDDADGFATEDVSDCRLEAEQYVADNYESDS